MIKDIYIWCLRLKMGDIPKTPVFGGYRDKPTNISKLFHLVQVRSQLWQIKKSEIDSRNSTNHAGYSVPCISAAPGVPGKSSWWPFPPMDVRRLMLFCSFTLGAGIPYISGRRWNTTGPWETSDVCAKEYCVWSRSLSVAELQSWEEPWVTTNCPCAASKILPSISMSWNRSLLPLQRCRSYVPSIAYTGYQIYIHIHPNVWSKQPRCDSSLANWY